MKRLNKGKPIKKLFLITLRKKIKISLSINPRIILAFFLLCAFSNSGQAENLNPTFQKLGRAIYKRYCEGCHGINGDGDGEYAKSLNPKPRDFTSGIYKWTSAPAGSMPTDRDLMMTISEGIHGTAMPPWASLKESERRAVVDYIKTFSDRFEKQPSSQATIIYAPPPRTAELIQRGRAIYQKTGCDRCHGLTGKGDGGSSLNLMDDWNNPILPTDFYHGTIKTGSEDWKLYRTIANGMGGTPMPTSVNQLEPNDIWALVYYIRSLKH